MNIYIIYLRVSTSEQKIGTQLEEIIERIKSIERGKEFRIKVFQDEDVSASKVPMHKRLGLVEMLAFLKKGYKVCIYSLFRLARDIQEMVSIHRQIKGSGCDIISIEETFANDEMIMTFMGAMAQEERKRTVARIHSRFESKRRAGEKLGSVHLPFGYGSLDQEKLVSVKRDGKYIQKPGILIEDQNEQNIVKDMIELFDAGLSYGAIAREIASRGHRSRAGTIIPKMSIYRILKRHGKRRESQECQMVEDFDLFEICV